MSNSNVAFVPNKARFQVPPSASSEDSRSTIQLRPTSGASFSPTGNRVISFQIRSASQFLDMKHTALSFVCTATGSQVRPANSCGIESVIQRVVIQSGGVTLLDMPNYNLVCALLRRALPKAWKESAGKYHVMGSQQERSDFVLNSLRSYVDLSPTGFGQMQNYLPLPFMGDGLTVDFHLADANDAMTVASSTATYTVTDARLTCDFVTMNAQYTRSLAQQLASGRQLEMHLEMFSATVESVSASTTNNLRTTLPYSSLKALWVYFNTSSDVLNATADVMSDWSDVNLSTAQFRIGNELYPRSPIDFASGGADAYYELMKSFGMHSQYLSGHEFGKNFAPSSAVGSNSDGSSMCVAIDLQRHNEGRQISGIDASGDSVPSELNLVHSSAPSASRAVIVSNYDASLVILPAGLVAVVN